MYQFADSYDHYTDPTTMYDSVGGSPTISSSYARFPAVGSFPNQGIHISPIQYVRKNLKSNAATIIAFASFGVVSLPSNPAILLSFWDGGGTNMQLFLGLNPTGDLQFYTQSFTFAPVAVGPASALGLVAPVPGGSTKPNHGVEVKVTFASGTGSVLCYLDGALVIALTTGLTTIKTGNAYCNQVALSAPNGSGWSNGLEFYCDYLRVWDSTGSTQNAPVGYDVRKFTKLPASAGDLTQWTANGAGSNYQCVNDNPPDGDTTYVSSTGNNYDSYGMGSSGLTGLPSMVLVKSYVRKDDANTRQMQIGARSSGTNGLGSQVWTLGSTYVFIDACIALDPNGGIAWTGTSADAAQHLKYEVA